MTHHDTVFSYHLKMTPGYEFEIPAYQHNNGRKLRILLQGFRRQVGIRGKRIDTDARPDSGNGAKISHLPAVYSVLTCSCTPA